MSLREFLWDKIYAPDEGMMAMPDFLEKKEVVVTTAAASIFMALCWFLVRRGFFLICESARPARAAALVFGIGISAAWVLGSLDRLGLDSTKWMIVIMVIFAVGTFAYLLWVRHR
jgi:hypothetical protein